MKNSATVGCIDLLLLAIIIFVLLYGLTECRSKPDPDPSLLNGLRDVKVDGPVWGYDSMAGGTSVLDGLVDTAWGAVSDMQLSEPVRINDITALPGGESPKNMDYLVGDTVYRFDGDTTIVLGVKKDSLQALIDANCHDSKCAAKLVSEFYPDCTVYDSFYGIGGIGGLEIGGESAYLYSRTFWKNGQYHDHTGKAPSGNIYVVCETVNNLSVYPPKSINYSWKGEKPPCPAGDQY